MRAVTLLALWFTVYGNINKTGKKCHDMQLSCIDSRVFYFLNFFSDYLNN